VQAEFVEIQETLRLEKEQANGGWLDLVKTPGNRKRSLLIVLTAFFSQCSGNGLVSYYLHDILLSVGITSAYDQSLINGGLQIYNLLISVGMAFTVDKIGRRPLFLAAGFGMILSFTAWLACSAVYAEQGNNGAGKAVIALIFIFFGVMGLAYPGLTVAYSMEILPYNLRAKGLGLLFAAANASSFINQ
jgi:MFS family permease